jgi:hypothetical protein
VYTFYVGGWAVSARPSFWTRIHQALEIYRHGLPGEAERVLPTVHVNYTKTRLDEHAMQGVFTVKYPGRIRTVLDGKVEEFEMGPGDTFRFKHNVNVGWDLR